LPSKAPSDEKPLSQRPPPESISAPRLTLRRHEASQAAVMFAHVDHDRDRLARFLPWVPFVTTVADEEAYIADCAKRWKDGTMFDYSLVLKDGGEYIGNAGVHTISWEHRRAEIGYWILGSHEGKGYVTEAAGALTRTLFDMGFHRVIIRTDDDNERSAAVPRRLSFRLEGVLRDHSLERGAYRTMRIYAKLATDL
jgi:RimJ/RimL family protein N-acetyltransferase